MVAAMARDSCNGRGFVVGVKFKKNVDSRVYLRHGLACQRWVTLSREVFDVKNRRFVSAGFVYLAYAF
jgi:hypothetical protein